MNGTRRSNGPISSAVATLGIALALSVVMGRRPERPREGSGDETSAARPDAAAREPGRGRDASSPDEIPKAGWWDIGWRVYEEIGKDRILAVAAGVTFYGLLALFPAIASFVSLYGLFSDPGSVNEHLNAMSGLLPGGAVDLIGEQVKRITSKGNTALGFASLFGIAASLWSANAGMKAIFDALNVAYGETEKRNFFFLNVTSLAFTLAGIAFLIGVVGSVVIVPIALKFLGLGGIADWLVWIGRWPAMLAGIFLALAVLYRYGPSRDKPRWLWITPGSLVAGIGWLGFSMLFSWYVGSFGNYNETYGSLGAAIGFMTWLWLSSTIILVGAELNAEVEHQTVRDTTEGAPQPLGSRGARMADTVGAARA